MDTEVIIVGKGIAGLVLSKLLNERGIDNLILARNDKRKGMPIPETLPPSTLPLLQSLNLLELFENNSSRTLGYHSIWGSESLASNHFFFQHPFQYGLKIHKQKVINNLEETVTNQILLHNLLTKVSCSEEKVEIEIEQGGSVKRIEGKLVVDATGRNRALTKKLRIPHEDYDDLIALSCHLPFKRHPKLKHQVFVESFSDGWGIVSSLNERTNAMSLFSKKSNKVLSQMKDYQQWNKVLSDTTFLKDFLVEGIKPKVMGGNANSSKLKRLVGNNWLAIGDAAIAFDPLSSHGISNAIYCASAAANAIESTINKNDLLALKAYQQTLNKVFGAYLDHKTKLYNTEKRWASNSFWSKPTSNKHH